MVGKIKKQQGFSLTELLMVIAIIGIVSVIMLLGLSYGRTAKQLESAAAAVTALVRESQVSALSGKQYIADTIPCGYQVAWSGSTYNLIYRYKNSSDVCNRSSIVSTQTLPAGTSFVTSSNVEFTLPFGKPTLTQTILLRRANENSIVCISQEGQVTYALGSSCP